ncbi:extracellular solute-binding protein [Jatrophihabitans sp. DSM 45814]
MRQQSRHRRQGRRRRKSAAILAIAAAATALLSACSSSSGNTASLTWYINPDNGGQATLAKECSAESNGTFKISTQILPNDASQQRQQLVTRLAAKDSSIDLMSIDPVFVAEFAEAGFLAPIPTADDAQFTKDIVEPAVQAATWNGKLVAAPFWANTQLLWYRKSIAQAQGLDMSKPVTWDQIINAAKKAGKTVGVQADLYEGYTVWINALISGAGGTIVENPGAQANDIKLGLDTPAGRDAATIIAQLSKAGVGGPALSTNEETQSLDLFSTESTSGFLVNWPYTYSQLTTVSKPPYLNDIGWTTYPETIAGQDSKPPFGGIEVAVGAYSKHQAAAIAATQCITSQAKQTEYMLNSGNPAANKTVFDDPAIQKQYPNGLAALIRQSLEASAPRPQTQYYGDLSTALQKSFSPPNSVNDATPNKASTYITQVLKGDKLL